MRKTSEARFEFDGHEYILSILRDHDPKNDRDSCSMSVGPAGAGFVSLGMVLASFWSDQAGEVLESIRTRVGLSKEGPAQYSFHEEYPDELPPGITVRLLEASETVSITDFVRFLSEFAPAYAKAAAAVGLKTHEELQPRLAELREQFEKYGDTIH
ncbi:MAG: hypothetical protein ACHQ51_02845 [Elusimicrobiota bacterium]